MKLFNRTDDSPMARFYSMEWSFKTPRCYWDLLWRVASPDGTYNQLACFSNRDFPGLANAEFVVGHVSAGIFPAKQFPASPVCCWPGAMEAEEVYGTLRLSMKRVSCARTS